MSAQPWPSDLTFNRAAKSLHIAFDDGAVFDIPFELLRVFSPSAEVRGHRESERKLVEGKTDVGVTRAEPVGRYAVRIVFDDGHDSGLYSWALLYELGRDREKKTNEYFLALSRKS
ncbi:MAG TPA: gamma-butyrobetaine hydroxylase-like domain-containing protein [Caulobacterales bacterium]|jgi:DUF971 family protein|nr:gamma-butyrobetaine hydroxylase-like domain-containing protein [Caulobacterales bacterium]